MEQGRRGRIHNSPRSRPMLLVFHSRWMLRPRAALSSQLSYHHYAEQAGIALATATPPKSTYFLQEAFLIGQTLKRHATPKNVSISRVSADCRVLRTFFHGILTNIVIWVYWALWYFEPNQTFAATKNGPTGH
jgi:hypothetical protein